MLVGTLLLGEPTDTRAQTAKSVCHIGSLARDADMRCSANLETSPEISAIPRTPNATGLIVEIADMAKFQELLQSDESVTAMREDGLKVETMRMLIEFTP